MNVSLTPQLEKLVHRKVKSGMYHTSSEVVREALRMMGERDRSRDAQLEELRREIAVGAEQTDRGDVVPGDVVFRRLRERNERARKNRR